MTFRVLSLTLLCAALACAQQTGISGRITDGTGAVIINAIIFATEAEGGKASVVTNSQGIYQFAAIPAANYKLRFEAPGFTPAEKTLGLLVGQELTVDVTLRPAATSSTVDVLGGADLIEASSLTVNKVS